MAQESSAEAASSYANNLKAQIAHAPVSSTSSERAHQVKNTRKRERIEPELVAATANLGRYAAIHNTKSVPGEVLPPGMERSCAGFLVNTNVMEAQIDAAKVKKEMEYLRKCVVIA
jgi:hypothetical protein